MDNTDLGNEFSKRKRYSGKVAASTYLPICLICLQHKWLMKKRYDSFFIRHSSVVDEADGRKLCLFILLFVYVGSSMAHFS